MEYDNVGKTIINHPWLGMVTIPPTKMVMTGGWFIIVLPTLHYFQRIFIDIYWGSHFRLQEVSPWMIEIPIFSRRIFFFNTMKLETMVVWMGWIMLIFPSVWLNIGVEHVFQYMLLSNRLIVVRAAVFGSFYRILSLPASEGESLKSPLVKTLPRLCRKLSRCSYVFLFLNMQCVYLATFYIIDKSRSLIIFNHW